MKKIIAADLFCGAGGFSSGLMEAAAHIGVEVELLAVNHWQIAIDTHSANYPDHPHICEGIETIDPRKAIPGGHLHLLMASPECTHHSNARGGKPMSDQSRATAWHILRWAEALKIDNILIENVREFREWGPLGVNGRPLKSKRGALYQNFLRSLRCLGYTVQDRVLNSANFGDATTRQRLFIQARKGRRVISWPEPSHVPDPSASLDLYAVQKWRSAREIIDWSISGQSIYARKRPLAPNTMARIMAGLRKFCGLPFVIGQQSCAAPRDVGDPLPTVATAGAISLIQPFLIGVGGGQGEPRDIDQPIGTILGENHRALIEPFIVVFRNNQDAHSIDKPLATMTTNGANFGLCQPFMVPVTHSGGSDRCLCIDAPFPTVTTAHRGELALVQPFLTEYHGGEQGAERVRSIDDPLCTLDTSNRIGLVQPFLVKFYGSGDGAASVDDPPLSITPLSTRAKRSFAVIDKGDRVAVLDIRFRMLQPHELSAAMSFPKDYQFAGNRSDKVKQIGNAVAVKTARALCLSVLGKAAA